eukprot:TRINITY_DN7362_c0_g1_i1.p1 TRINITY_DN7362_c0_g1~~TRINITY_DN7362_c0_g1_i1.p1  ORF type:complete len:242 (-),score=72.93 TRINITY_DN7362_c0_g1_i1:111-785(-)
MSRIFLRPLTLSTAGKNFSTSQKHTLPDLPYDYGALEPVISGKIMELHHSKHHNAYVTNLNASLEKYHAAQASGDVSAMISVLPAIKFNGGGHVNHSIFWKNLAPPSRGGGVPPPAELLKEIEKVWGTFENFVQQFNAQTAAVQGSGWGWLGVHKQSKTLQIATTANQDPLEATTDLIPLLGIDVWEHAYYLDYKNVRPDYLKNIWKVVNWADVNERWTKVKKH